MSSPAPLPTAIWNVPNRITALRLALSIVLFVVLAWPTVWYPAALVLFVVAASTDWIDGYWARKYNQVTQLGRIFDPFVDKVIICGTFIFLAAVPDSGIAAWMAVTVVARELLVTVLRSFLEQHGADFSAKFSGKLKMLFQCGAAVASLLALSYSSAADRPDWLGTTLAALVWLAVLSTIQSGAEYVVVAARLLRKLGNGEHPKS